MRSIDNSFYSSGTWIACRDSYLKYVGGLCERCKKKGSYVPAVIVHHKEHLSPENFDDPSIVYGFDNLEALCLRCHNKEHFGREIQRRFVIGEHGEVIPVGE